MSGEEFLRNIWISALCSDFYSDLFYRYFFSLCILIYLRVHKKYFDKTVRD